MGVKPKSGQYFAMLGQTVSIISRKRNGTNFLVNSYYVIVTNNNKAPKVETQSFSKLILHLKVYIGVYAS